MLMCIEFVDSLFCGLCSQNVQFVSKISSSRFTGNVTDMSVLGPFSMKHGRMPGAVFKLIQIPSLK